MRSEMGSSAGRGQAERDFVPSGRVTCRGGNEEGQRGATQPLRGTRAVGGAALVYHAARRHPRIRRGEGMIGEWPVLRDAIGKWGEALVTPMVGNGNSDRTIADGEEKRCVTRPLRGVRGTPRSCRVACAIPQPALRP